MGNVTINQQRLHRELAIRGWTGADLCRHAAICKPTISWALSGRPIRPRTLKKIADALSHAHGCR